MIQVTQPITLRQTTTQTIKQTTILETKRTMELMKATIITQAMKLKMEQMSLRSNTADI